MDQATGTGLLEAQQDSFAVRLDAALTESGLPLARISKELASQGIRCSASTLSLWRNGRTRPRRENAVRAVEALEGILGTAPGHLTGAPQPDPVPSAHWWNTPVPPQITNDVVDLDDAVKRFALPPALALQFLSVTAIQEYDENRRFVCTRVSAVVRATRDFVEQTLASSRPGETEGTPPLHRIEPGAGVRRGRSREFLDRGETVTELILAEPLHRGQTGAFEYTVLSDAGREETAPGWQMHRMYCQQPSGRVTVGARFHPDALPVETMCEIIDNEAGDDQIVTERHIPCYGNVLLATHKYLRQGAVGVRWRWE